MSNLYVPNSVSLLFSVGFLTQTGTDDSQLARSMFEFTKMHALGNDFVVIDSVETVVSFDPAQAKSVADRHTGIGCDQILLVSGAGTNVFDFRIYNADGSESAQCGNGARCVARLLHDRGYPTKRDFMLQTTADEIRCEVGATDVTVALGVPRFNPSDIPFIGESEQLTYDLQVNDEMVQVSALSIGNPHAVLLVDDVDQAPVIKSGPVIESHSKFPQRTNVAFLQVVSRDQVRLRVYERGVGETFACGSGACAAVAAGIRLGLLNDSVEVMLMAGSLFVEWTGDGTAIYLSGPATYVYEGRWIA